MATPRSRVGTATRAHRAYTSPVPHAARCERFSAVSRAECSIDDAGTGGTGQDQRRRSPSETPRDPDHWWREPRITAAALTIWVAYACVHVFLGRWYWVPRYHYLTPFYSPCVSGACAPGGLQPGHLVPEGAVDHSVRDRGAAVHPGLPAELLLLPQGLLPGVLPRPGGLRGPRAARQLQRRDQVPADHAEPAPVLLLPGHPGLRS